MRSLEIADTIVETPLAESVAQARTGNSQPLAELMRAHNQRLFRIARSILRDDAEAEDIVQEAFVKAFTQTHTLLEPAKIGAWLAKIAANLALDRLRAIKRQNLVVQSENSSTGIENMSAIDVSDQLSPERLAAMGDVREILEAGIDQLPDGFREVFVLRTIEQMSVEETATALDIQAATVKTRLHRAKALLRKTLENQLTAVSLKAFPFGGVRCAKTTEAVLARLQGHNSNNTNSHH